MPTTEFTIYQSHGGNLDELKFGGEMSRGSIAYNITNSAAFRNYNFLGLDINWESASLVFSLQAKKNSLSNLGSFGFKYTDEDEYHIVVSSGDMSTSYKTFTSSETNRILEIIRNLHGENKHWFSLDFQIKWGTTGSSIKDVKLILTYSLKTYTITTNVNDTNGGTVTRSANGPYTKGTQLTLTATPNGNYNFVGWSDGVTTSTRSITVTGNKTYTANFQKKQSTINFSSDGNGTITVKKDGAAINTGATADYGTTIDCKANPASGYAFDYWKVNDVNVGSNINYSFTASQDTYTIVAVFRELQITQLQITEVSILGNDDQAVVPSQSSAANIRIKIKPTYG